MAAKARRSKSKRSKPATCKRVAPAPPPDDLVQQVRTWIIQGQKEPDILEAIREHAVDADPDEVVTAAIGEIIKAGQVSRDLIHGWCLEAFQDLYMRMREIGDFAGALKAVKAINDLTR